MFNDSIGCFHDSLCIYTASKCQVILFSSVKVCQPPFVNAIKKKEKKTKILKKLNFKIWGLKIKI